MGRTFLFYYTKNKKSRSFMLKERLLQLSLMTQCCIALLKQLMSLCVFCCSSRKKLNKQTEKILPLGNVGCSLDLLKSPRSIALVSSPTHTWEICHISSIRFRLPQRRAPLLHSSDCLSHFLGGTITSHSASRML